MVDFREPSLRLQFLMRVGPTRLSIVLLLPMNQGSFVAPFEDLSHRLSVRSSQHEIFHCGFAGPHSAGPECAVTVAEQRRRDISLRMPCLTGRSKSVEKKWN